MNDLTPPSGPAPDDRAIGRLLAPFRPISLDEVNATARMLKRTDRKYVVDRVQLAAVLAEMTDDYRLLEMDGARIFSYRSCYYDDDFKTYHDHQRGIRQRFKARTRQYVDTGEFFFELKLKSGRGQTNKIRMRSDNRLASEISEQQLSRLHRQYQETYGKPFPYELTPSLYVAYQRASLASDAGGERVTIDLDLRFEAVDGRRFELGPDFIVIETKSAAGRGRADRILKGQGIRKVKRCSKYCIGSILSGQVYKQNSFRRIMRLVRARMPPEVA